MNYPYTLNTRIMKLFILTLLLLSGTILEAEMRKGPYLIYPNSDTKMSVLWQIKNDVECTIDWGRDASYSDGLANTKEIISGADGHLHKYTITDLIPNQKYYYRIKENSNFHTGTFMSGGAVDTTRMLIYGDTRTLLTNHNSVAKSIVNYINENPKWQTMLMHCGDWNSDDKETTWDKEHFSPKYFYIKEMLSELPVMGARGNHEADAAQFNKYYSYDYVKAGSSYYSFDYGYAHISVIDEYTSYSIGSAQYNWLKNDVQTSTKPWKILLFHEPIYSDDGERAINENARKYLQPFCEEYGIKLVFAGHNHLYAHSVVNGVNHFTFGGGGAPLHATTGVGVGLVKSISTYSYGRISLTKDKFQVVAVDTNGTILDNVGITDGTTYAEQYKSPKIELYPNPSSDILYYSLLDTESGYTVIIYDNIGKEIVKTEPRDTNSGSIDVSGIATGSYIIEIKWNEGSYTQSISIIR